MATTYKIADDVQKRADKLIEKVHTHLDGVHIEYVFRDPAAKSGQRIKLAKARKISGLNAFLAGYSQPYLIIEVAEEEWKNMTAAQEKALVDHELSHCGWDVEKNEPYIVPHDVEEFAGVIERHGLWRNDLKNLGAAVQLHLEYDPAVQGE